MAFLDLYHYWVFAVLLMIGFYAVIAKLNLIKKLIGLSLFYGPTINSYKRYQPGSWAPTRMAWSTDNRTTGFSHRWTRQFVPDRKPHAGVI